MVALGEGWTKTTSFVPARAAGGTVTGATDAAVTVECIGGTTQSDEG